LAGDPADGIRVGLHSGQQYHSFEECRQLWASAEALGFDVISLFDHLRPPIGGPAGPCFEGPTLLAGLAAQVPRIRCCLLVSAVTWRHPALSAAMAVTLDHVSGGRIEFGLGAGGPDLGYRQFGIAFPPIDVRMDMLAESCQVHRALWSGDPVSFSGRYFRLDDARLVPAPVQRRIPLIVGGHGERRLLRIVAEHADRWNTLAGDIGAYRHRTERLAGYCAAAGRAPADIRRSVTFRAVLGPTQQAADRRAAELFAGLPMDSPDRAEFLAVGTPQKCVNLLAEFARLGARDFLLAVRPPLDWETIMIMARDVRPALRELGGASGWE
jgi:alkanesulfonate monooxygenase SsuD/methylene tetrahydromethanopterin reductase-like flavin-dependent oxidoreductase (luciferase family)